MKNFIKIFQIAAVFIGTIVGAGLASGKEITTFFTKYGYISFLGILLTGIFYIFICLNFKNNKPNITRSEYLHEKLSKRYFVSFNAIYLGMY